MKSPRIILAGFCHETNTFADDHTDLDVFGIRRGEELLACRNDGSPLGAFVDFAEKSGWSLLPLIDYRAMPSGMVRDEVVESYWREFAERARGPLQKGIDAIFLVLHGAMVSESIEDVEGEILARIRALPGVDQVPIFGVTDLHGNFTERMARHANLLMTYQENPHTDAAETAVKAAKLLEKTLRTGQVPRTCLRQFPLVWPPTGTATAASPMSYLEATARRLEAKGHWSVNVYAGFALADVRDTGVSVAIADTFPDDVTESALDEMEAVAWQHRSEGLPSEENLEEALDAIAASSPSGAGASRRTGG